MAALRRRRLQQLFGSEHDRLVGERGSRRRAEAQLTGRERRVQGLDIQPLTEVARVGYAGQWTSIQEQFVDAPAELDRYRAAEAISGKAAAGTASTEDLRAAVQPYRAFGGRLAEFTREI